MRGLQGAALAAILGLGALTAAVPATARADVYIGVSVGVPPPPLPVYEQPPIPGPGYIWTPGYWAWDGDDDDYYWVPGTWVLAPEPGLLWTPAWWGWDDGEYVFHGGYWGPQVGFYGGVDYGFGYTGFGYEGGYWDHDRFFYNRTVNNITNVNITNVYNRTVINNRVTNVSYNGGPGGLNVRPTPAQLAVAHEFHAPPTQMQLQHQHVAAAMPLLHASANHGLPPIAATARPAVLRGPGVAPALRSASFGARAGQNPSIGPAGLGQRGARGTMGQGPARLANDPRFNPRGAPQDMNRGLPLNGREAVMRPGPGGTDRYGASPPAQSLHASEAQRRQDESAASRAYGDYRHGPARAADRYGAPATAESFRAPEPRSMQDPYAASRGYDNYRPGREPPAPPRMPQYAERRAPEPYGGGFGGERRGPPPAEAFRPPPRGPSPGGEPRAAPPRPLQGHENPRREPPQ